MSIVLWENNKHYKCPHCGGLIRMQTQESESYGINSFLFNPKTDEFLVETDKNGKVKK